MRTGLIAASVLLLAACMTAQNANYTQDPGWKAPANAAGRKNPLAGKTTAVAGGKKLFQRNCTICHGENGTGAIPTAANLQLPIVQDQSDGTLFWKITNGNQGKGMPSFSGLPEMQRWQLVLYLRALKAATPK